MVDWMAKKEFTVIIERDAEGWFVSDIPELQGCHTQAKTVDELMKRTKEAIALCLEEKKPYSKNEFVGVQTIEV
ncbi:MAG: type II toxin-antitoxin system HicB family antitoxin [Candidatus Izemoplasmatales bacterium]|jgi:predicted RNase H-like HicB family nuclease